MLLLALSSIEFAERSLFLVDMVVGVLCNRPVRGSIEAKRTDRDKYSECLFPLHSCSRCRNMPGVLTHGWLHTFVL